MNQDPSSVQSAHDGQSAANRSGGAGDGGAAPPQQQAPQPAPPARRLARVLVWALATGVVLAAGLVLALYVVLTTEPGTRTAWRAAVALSAGRLSGTFEGGTIANGLRLANVRWHGAAGGDDIRIDRLAGRWALTRTPWRFTLELLRIGTIDARIAPSPASKPFVLPADLRLPLALDIRAVLVDKIVVHEAASATRLERLRFHGSSDGRRHTVSLDGLDTPYGALVAKLSLDGVRPFTLAGDAALAGTLEREPAQVSAHLAGALEAFGADIDASGMKLAGRAHVEATPFSAVPFKRATVSIAHVNPQAFAPGAPEADLSLEAALAPVAGARTLVVAGPVSITNATPGLYIDHKLPLIDAHADVRLDARAQRIDALRVRLVKGARLEGGGTLTQGRGQFALHATDLDLATFTHDLRPTALGGPLTVDLDGARQSLEFDLTDARAPLRARARIAFEATQIAIHTARVDVGSGRAELSGTLARDAAARYTLEAKLIGLDPRLLLAPRAAGPAKAGAPAPRAWPEARVTGTFDATGALAPSFSTKLRFLLADSVYDGLPLTGKGTVQFADSRLAPSDASLSIAGNDVDVTGSFGAPGDRLRFHVDAPRLERLGFGLAGAVRADGDVTGSIAHPNVALNYDARGVAFGDNRIGAATGHAQMRDGATGALELTTDARDVHTPVVALQTLTAHLTGTRAKHTLDAAAVGTVRGRPLDATLAAAGSLADTPGGVRWRGSVTRLANRGMPALELQAPLTVDAAPTQVTLGPTRLTLEGAQLDLKSFVYDHGAVRSAGAVSNLSIGRLLAIQRTLTGQPSRLSSDLVLVGDWDFDLGRTARGYARIERQSGDVSVQTGRGVAALGITALSARGDFTSGSRLGVTVHAAASRIGTADAKLGLALAPDPARGGVLGVAPEAPVSGTIAAQVPALKTTGGLFGPSYVLDGHLALNLTLAGTVSKPALSGSLIGDGLSATFVDQGVQFKDGVVRVALTENLVELQHVEFRGGDGTLRATGRIRLDSEAPDLTASIVADNLELFAAPDRQLRLSGSAKVANGGLAEGIDIDGKFRIDHALFDMPEKAAPRLSDDVVIVRDGSLVRGAPPPLQPGEKPVGRFAPHASVDIDLGNDFRFRGQGADLGLRGTVTMLSAPNQPLKAVGNVRVTEGSTYTSFGRKLAIENGFFTFNGPVANPGINILAMRRNQEVEAGVQVTGTVRAPTVKLVSEPNVADNEKLSWLLFGHGTDQGNNLGQQSSMTTALALLGSATGKRVAQTFGLDEFSVGRSDVGLTDPEVVTISKAINERLVLGYEQGLQSASNAFKATVNLSRFWSVAAYGGTFQGVDISYTRRFDSWWSRH
jgi:translocation and assembly module TamB